MANLCGGGCNINEKGCSKKTDKKLDTFDWLCDIPESQAATDLIEVTFKNTRKGYFRNTNDLKLEKGDVVAVEANPGHDIGTVSLTGQLVLLQMKKNHIDPARVEIRRVYRKARPVDLEKFEDSKAKEHDTMLRARKIAEDLKLNMKIGDVEYQGDGNKAIFYYIADERVDFRQLIKVLADAFKVRIEMKQIGARQEAGRIGGIGPCGRPLCCSSWMSSFVSVATSAARYQEISLNPQKLAGQCAKLKCCMNFEVDAYVEAQRGFPSKEIQLETKDATYYHFKTDVFGGIMQYSSSPNMAANIISVPVERVKEIIALNKQGIKVESLLEENDEEEKITDYENVVGQDSLTRFDKKKKNKNKNRQSQPQTQQENSLNVDNNEKISDNVKKDIDEQKAEEPQQENQPLQTGNIQNPTNSEQRDNNRNRNFNNRNNNQPRRNDNRRDFNRNNNAETDENISNKNRETQKSEESSQHASQQKNEKQQINNSEQNHQRERRFNDNQRRNNGGFRNNNGKNHHHNDNRQNNKFNDNNDQNSQNSQNSQNNGGNND